MDTPDPVALVKLEAAFYRSPSRRLQAARDRWGLSMTQYAYLVNAALDDPVVAAAAPVEVRMLRERRDAAMRVRSARRAS